LILSPEDRVFLYTDGIVEAEIGDEQFGLDGLNAVLQQTSRLNLPEQARAVIQAVSRPDGEHLSDDATIFAFEFHTPTPVKATVTA